MITADEFTAELTGRGIGVVAGVPCSYLAGPIMSLTAQGRYIPAANEGAALAIACGAAAAGVPAAVIAQNSGLGNLVNPLTSLQVTYRIPVLVFITLRGWPDPAGDEPQHAVMGGITHRLLDLIGARHWTLQPSPGSLRQILDQAAGELSARNCAFVLVPRATVGGPAQGDQPAVSPQPAGTGLASTELTREQAIGAVLSCAAGLPVVSTTGYTSRTAFALGDRPENFYMQGSMGHAAAFALGVATRRAGHVIVLDGDGAALMHLGTMSTIGAAAPAGLVHVILDNGRYESTGGQLSTAATTDFDQVALAAGYASAVSCDTAGELRQALAAALAAAGPHLIAVRTAVAGGGPPPRATSKLAAPDIYQRFSAAIGGAGAGVSGAGGAVSGAAASGAGAAIGGAGAAASRAGDGGPRVVFGTGTLATLPDEIARYRPDRILVVASPARAAAVRAGPGGLPVLAGRAVRFFSGFTPNPALEQILAGCALRDDWRPDLIIGIGGGSAMDVAKAVRLLPAGHAAAMERLREGPAASYPDQLAGTPLILVPTTAGTGSEVTRFATLFDGWQKMSLDHRAVQADLAIVDPAAAAGCPLPVTSSCAMDALCHAVESLWAVSSTPASAAAAGAALAGLRPLTGRRLDHLTPSDRELLSAASLQAGHAINITRTTAAHAFAYRLTAQFGIPHGVSCLINLSWLYGYNREHAQASCTDPRGGDYVTGRLNDVAKALALDPAELPGHLLGMLRRNGWPDRLRDYGIGAGHLPDIVTAGLGYGRSRGNPVGLDPAAIADCLRRRL